ncbi:MAG: N-6 DNA methylase [Nanoarchaeota archaeon]|nr:N-6 DNA methylase [Nanoarchaeota archaeon]
MEPQLFLENSPALKLKKDFFSYTFEKNNSVETRHEKGQYFTHKELVKMILDQVPITSESKILDPTCGAGAFLMEALKKGDITNIYGVDIDKKALESCKMNLGSKSTNLIEENFIKEKIFEKEFFDVIIGNPPFQNLRADGLDYDPYYPIYQKVTSGIANSSTLVLAKSYELLKEGGYLGFVLPKNFIRVDSFRNIRKFLLENTRIISIIDVDHHFKDVRCDQILMILQKKRLTQEELKKNLVSITPYKKLIELNKQEAYGIIQSEFFNYAFYPLFYDLEVKKIADKLIKIGKTLKDCSQIFRGISIGSLHLSLSKSNGPNLIKCYRGDSIKRFGLKYYLYLDESKLIPTEIKKLSRLLKEKIVIQNIFSKEGGVFLNFSSSDEVSLDTVTNIIPNKDINPFLLMGILGSKLSNFFLINVVYLNSNFTMHTDKLYIGTIPVILPDKQKEDLIQGHVEKLIGIKDKYSPEFNETYAKLNKIIYQIYQITGAEIKTIEEFLKGAMSKKHHG